MKFCFVIPNYNHVRSFDSLIRAVKQFDYPIYIINDASDPNAKLLFEQLVEEDSQLHLINHEQNKGKGGAVKTGLRAAYSHGYTHAIQIDADGQHQIDDIGRFIELSRQFPSKVISGKPVYDESIPMHRYLARYITHFWVCVETLSMSLKDTMCGFRVYPLSETIQLINNTQTGNRMDFDIEILVRLYWAGVKTHFIETSIIYPEDGLSHFRSLEDNLLISWLHTRLFFGMLIRIPRLLRGS